MSFSPCDCGEPDCGNCWPIRPAKEEFCPNCKISFLGNEIPKQDQWAFGTTHFSRVIGIEDPTIYDGISWWQCPDCEYRWEARPNER